MAWAVVPLETQQGNLFGLGCVYQTGERCRAAGFEKVQVKAFRCPVSVAETRPVIPRVSKFSFVTVFHTPRCSTLELGLV